MGCVDQRHNNIRNLVVAYWDLKGQDDGLLKWSWIFKRHSRAL